MKNTKMKKALKKDILHLSLGILTLVILPIIAFISHSLTVWYYILPSLLGIVFLKGLLETYALYKNI